MGPRIFADLHELERSIEQGEISEGEIKKTRGSIDQLELILEDYLVEATDSLEPRGRGVLRATTAMKKQ